LQPLSKDNLKEIKNFFNMWNSDQMKDPSIFKLSMEELMASDEHEFVKFNPSGLRIKSHVMHRLGWV
jgi:hypothetical protein